jgi:hypothetical protein
MGQKVSTCTNKLNPKKASTDKSNIQRFLWPVTSAKIPTPNPKNTLLTNAELRISAASWASKPRLTIQYGRNGNTKPKQQKYAKKNPENTTCPRDLVNPALDGML